MQNKISILEAAALSHFIEAEAPGDPPLPAGWRIYRSTSNGSLTGTGYFGLCCLKGDSPTHIVFVHCGTQFDDIRDIIQDVGLIFNQVEAQYSSAKEFYYSTLADLKSQYPSIAMKIQERIIQVGHSLGAILAELMCGETGTETITFDSPGSKEAIKNMLERSNPPINKSALTTLQEKCTTIQAHWNIINTLKEQSGKVNLLSTPFHYDSSLLSTTSIPGLPLIYPLPSKLLSELPDKVSSDSPNKLLPDPPDKGLLGIANNQLLSDLSNKVLSAPSELLDNLGTLSDGLLKLMTDPYYTLNYSWDQHAIRFIEATLSKEVPLQRQEFWPAGFEEGYKYYRTYNLPDMANYWDGYIERIWDSRVDVQLLHKDRDKFHDYFVKTYLYYI